MRLEIDLGAVWSRFAARGLLKNEFVDSAGRRIEAGVRVGPQGPETYAIDAATGAEACERFRLERLPNHMDILYNPVGGLKPHTRPGAPGRQPDLPSDAVACSFKCQDPDNPVSLVHRLPLAQISSPHFVWRALPNVAPWEPRGLLVWVPCTLDGGTVAFDHVPQILTRAGLEDFLDLARSAAGLATFFNSLHGGASANHLHFQAVHCDRPLAVEFARRAPCGRRQLLREYSASGLFFPSAAAADEIWPAIDAIQRAGYPFNLIALSSGLYLFVRNPEAEVLEEFPGRAFGAINFAGLFISSDPNELARVSTGLLENAYARMTLPPESVIGLAGAS